MAVYKLTVRLTHTTGTYIPCSLYTHLEYSDTVHNNGNSNDNNNGKDNDNDGKDNNEC